MTSGSHVPHVTEETGISGPQRKKSAPRWLPISLLAFSTVALVAPVVLLRRHKANLLSKSLEEAPPPRRTTTVTTSTAAIRPRQLTQHSPITAETCIQEMHSVSPPEAEDNFNGALHSLKAFGYATLIVMAGGLTTVWGVKTYMGVENTQEFATRMRSFLQAKMPGLMARLHRPTTDEDGVPLGTAAPSHASSVSRGAISASTGTTEWSWPDAEERLKTAFERGGITGWAEAMLQELEAESNAERRKRRHP